MSNSIFSRLLGTTEKFFSLFGPTGTGTIAPTRLGSDQSATGATTNGLEVKNDSGTAFVNARAADPIVGQDLVTLQYLQANPAPSSVQMITVPIALVTPKDSTTVIPAGAVVVDARVTITTPYDGGAAIEVGSTGNPNDYMAGADSHADASFTYDAPQRFPVTTASVVRVTILGAPTVGSGFVDVFYVVTPKS